MLTTLLEIANIQLRQKDMNIYLKVARLKQAITNKLLFQPKTK